jgi:hypothetical protein
VDGPVGRAVFDEGLGRSVPAGCGGCVDCDRLGGIVSSLVVIVDGSSVDNVSGEVSLSVDCWE